MSENRQHETLLNCSAKNDIAATSFTASQQQPDGTLKATPLVVAQPSITEELTKETKEGTNEKTTQTNLINTNVENTFSNTPQIPEQVYQTLPQSLRQIIAHYEAGSRQRDVFATGLFTALSGCLDGLTGIFRRKRVWSTLYSFILAPAGSGKGVLDDVKHVIQPLHDHLCDPTNLFNQVRLLLPGDISTAMLMQLLNGNKGQGVLIESEADILGNSFKQDHGNSMDAKARANYHHETIRVARKSNNEYFDIANPRMSIAISGTFKQIFNVITSPENGLFSRFVFYAFEQETYWDDMDMDVDVVDLIAVMETYGRKLIEVYEDLKVNPRTFSITRPQLDNFNDTFRQHLIISVASHGKVVESTVKRMSLIVFRLAMIFTAFRAIEHGSSESKLVCTDTDFTNAMALAGVYLEHAKAVLTIMPDDSIGQHDKMRHFFLSLPNEFKREEILPLAQQQEVPVRTMDRWLDKILEAKKLALINRGHYKKA